MDRRLSSSSSSSQPPFSTPRRRVTSPPGSQVGSVPARPGSSRAPSTPASPSSAEKDNHIEILFSHPVTKVVNFTVSASALKRPELPWRGPEERTIASGPLRIYRTLPQEVAFLQSGSALRPLLKRTQCWNVDGNRVFCLQLRPGNYWRIEILGPEEDQALQIEAFKATLSNIIAYEVTTCPFIRAPECEPLVEHPELMTPARVWSRAHLRRASDTPTTPPIEGFSFVHIPTTEPAHDTRSVKSGGDERPRKNYELHDERDCRSDYSSGSTGGPSLVSQRVKLLEACNELEEPVNLSTGRKWQKPTFPGEEDPSAESQERKGKLPQVMAEEAASKARERALKRRATTGGYGGSHPPPTPRSASETTVPAFDPINNWLDLTPPVSPLSSKGQRDPNSLPEEEEDEQPVSPTWRPAQPSATLLERRGSKPEAIPALDISPSYSEKAPSTPGLSSCASEDEPDLDLQRPHPFALVDPRTVAPVLRNTAASLGLTKKAHQLATSASYIVFRPSTYIVSTMVSIATRVTSTATVGAAFMTTEQGELKWSDDADPLEGLGYGSPPGSPALPWSPTETWAVDH